VRRVAQIGGGLLAGGVAIKLLPQPVIIVSVFVGLSYVVVRGLLVLVRWVWSQVLQIDVRWPDLGFITARRRMEQVMALADERILTLTQELAEARDRIGELETERDGLERARRTAEARIEQLQHELQSAREALQAAGEELRRRPHEPDPLYRRVGLDPDCPDFVLKAARRAYRVTLHEDKHPPEHKRVAHEKLVAAEQVFDTLFQRRGLRV
jgi:hypothetical protein